MKLVCEIPLLSRSLVSPQRERLAPTNSPSLKATQWYLNSLPIFSSSRSKASMLALKVLLSISKTSPWRSRSATNLSTALSDMGCSLQKIRVMRHDQSSQTIHWYNGFVYLVSNSLIVRPVGIEPTTISLKGSCSTDWATGACTKKTPETKYIGNKDENQG